MLGPFQPACEAEAETESSSSALERACATVRRTCRSQGLSAGDADDVSQEVFLWLLRNRHLVDVVQMSWLAGVTRNFVLRHRHARALRLTREARAGDALRDRDRDRDRERRVSLETKLALDRVEALLPDLESRLLKQVRGGVNFATALANLDIPRGSGDCLRKRLIARVTSLVRNTQGQLPRIEPKAGGPALPGVASRRNRVS